MALPFMKTTLLTCMFLAVTSAHGQDLNEILTKLKATKAGMTSVHATGRHSRGLAQEYLETHPGEGSDKETAVDFQWATKGDKFAQKWMDSDKTAFIRVGDPKGNRTFKMLPGETHFYESSKAKALHVEDILDFGYRCQGDWLCDIISSGNFKVTGQSTDPKFGDIVTITGTRGKGPMIYTFDIAPKTGCMAVRTLVEIPKVMRQIYQVEDTKTFSDFALASNMTKRWFVTTDRTKAKPEGREVLYLTENYTVSEGGVNDVPDSIFVVPGG